MNLHIILILLLLILPEFQVLSVSIFNSFFSLYNEI